MISRSISSKGRRANSDCAFFKEQVFTVDNIFRADYFDGCSLMMLVLEQKPLRPKIGTEARMVFAKGAQDGFIACVSRGAMSIARAHLLAKSNDHHFLDAAPQVSAEVGVRLDAVEDDDAVRCEGGNTEDDIQAVEGGADFF